EEGWQVEDLAVLEHGLTVRPDDEQAGVIARARGPQRNAFFRQVEVEQVDAHGYPCKNEKTRPAPSDAGRVCPIAASGVGGNLHRDDRVRIAHRLAALDLVDDIHALDDLAPDGIL